MLQPASVDTSPGSFVPVTLVSEPSSPTGCTKDPRMEDIVASDAASLEQLEFLKNQIEQALDKAVGERLLGEALPRQRRTRNGTIHVS